MIPTGIDCTSITTSCSLKEGMVKDNLHQYKTHDKLLYTFVD